MRYTVIHIRISVHDVMLFRFYGFFFFYPLEISFTDTFDFAEYNTEIRGVYIEKEGTDRIGISSIRYLFSFYVHFQNPF